ncbi:MAG TPA: glycosyltransferase [Bacteroidales bacterium]|nr:glycosyltransferase [Bacteroidales bacterium]HSA43493.1 glycosyltransferase [Bacteroidales bacterium]
MKTVLILAYDFPPLRSAGAQRPASWYRHLHVSGWYPAVVTRHWDPGSEKPENFVKSSNSKILTKECTPSGSLIRVPYKANFRDRMILKYGLTKFRFIRRMLSFIISVLRFYLPCADPSRAIYRSAAAYLDENPADLIIATGEPFILFKYAFLLSRKYKIPYLLDYRDAWNTGDRPDGSLAGKIIHFPLLFFLERKYFRHAIHVTTPARCYAEKLRRIHGGTEVSVIMNGFQAEALPPESPAATDNFTVIYSGKLYPWQPLEVFLSILDSWLEEHHIRDFSMLFIGTDTDGSVLRRFSQSKAFGSDRIQFTGRLDYYAYIRLLHSAHLLLLLSKPGHAWLNAKLFDYLAAGRPVLMFQGREGEMETIIRSANAGVVAGEKDEAVRVLDACYREYRANGNIATKPIDIDQYSRERQCALLAEILDRCVV